MFAANYMKAVVVQAMFNSQQQTATLHFLSAILHHNINETYHISLLQMKQTPPLK